MILFRSRRKLRDQIADLCAQLRIALAERDAARQLYTAEFQTAFALEADLGREREDHRATRRREAGHLTICPLAQAVHEEDAAKARMR